MELDGDLSDSEGETWPTDGSNSSGNESGQFEHRSYRLHTRDWKLLT